MAANFVAASSQRIRNTTVLVTAMPFTVGVWASSTVTNGFAVWSLSDTGTTNNSFTMGSTIGTTWTLNALAGGTAATASGPSVVVNRWAFILCRCISAINRRIAVLSHLGITHGQSTPSRVPSGIDTLSIGSTETSSPSVFFPGSAAEFWYTATDIQPDGTQLQDSLLRRLAYGGPFSVPHIAKDIIEYRSLRVHPDSRGDRIGEVYFGRFGYQTWDNTNGVTIGPHPPLPYSYVKPQQNTRLLTV